MIEYAGVILILAIAGFSIKTYLNVNQKVDRNYQRINEIKEDIDNKHVRKDICHLLHETLDKDVKEIKFDIKKLLADNGIL